MRSFPLACLAHAVPLVAFQEGVDREKAAAFMARVRELGKTYEEQKERSQAQLLEGKCDEANGGLLGLVPEEQRSSAHDFLLGNLLFSQDPAAAYRLHERAYRSEPDHPFVVLEWALEQHRARQFAEAEALYAKFLAVGPDPKVLALRSDCLLRLGRLAEGVAAWETANPRDQHSEIETGFSWVYGTPDPHRRRCDLLGEIRAGKHERIEDLIALDLHWDRDWWNVDPKPDALERDLRLAAELLGRDSRRFRELELCAEFCGAQSLEEMLESVGEALGRTAEVASSPSRRGNARFEKALRDAGLLGELPRLPERSLVARLLFDRMIEEKLLPGPEALDRYERELWERAESKGGDLEALRILAATYESTRNPALARADRLGWQRYRDPRFAASLLAGTGGALRTEDPLLVEALSAHPEDPAITRLALAAARSEGKPLKEWLVRFIVASFTHLESWQDVKDAFPALKEALAAGR